MEGLLAKFLEHALCHGVAGMAGEPLLQNLPSTIFVSLRHVEPRQVEAGLIEIARRGGIPINAQDPFVRPDVLVQPKAETPHPARDGW